MAPTVVVLDANVLYSIEVTDVVLTLATRRIIRVHWSPAILDEVRRNLALRPDLAAVAIEYRIGQMNLALPGALDEAPPDLVAAMPVNAKDRHVLALAVHVGASAVVTDNVRDFPAESCQPFGIEALTPDHFLTREARFDPDGLLEAIGEIAARRERPAMTVAEIFDRLASTLPAFVALLRPLPGTKQP